MENILLFKKQLEALAFTMNKADEVSFAMDKYYETTEKRSCGYVACICGEQALSGRLELFDQANSFNNEDNICDFISVACLIDDDFYNACKDATGNLCLAISVTSPSNKMRYVQAHSSKRFTHQQLKHPHLTTKSSPKHAVDYIMKVLNVLD